MKCKFSSTWRVAVATVLAISVSLMTAVPVMADSPASVDLGSAANFAVLAGSGITNTGTTTITGDIGTHPTTTMDGPGSITLYGTDHAGDATTQAAKTALATAYGDAAGRTPTTIATELGTTSPVPGVYNSAAGTFGITGTLTLTGSATDVWIFQSATTLITAADSKVILTGGARASNVFWKVGSSATLGTNSVFRGNILALTSITIDTGAKVYGRALASNAHVTLDANTISVPPTTWGSYSDSAHTIPSDDFDNIGSEHTVYMYGTGFASSHSYRVAYYDGASNKIATDDVTSGASGNVSSQHTFVQGTDTAGTWYAIVSEPANTPPSTYDAGWAFTIVTDTFVVQDAAIPEFPTVMAVIVILSLCLVMYLWMRHRVTKAYA